MASCSSCEGLLAAADRDKGKKVVGSLALLGLVGLLVYAATRD